MKLRGRTTLLALVLAASLTVPLGGAAAPAEVGWAGSYATIGVVTIPQGTTLVLDTYFDLTGMVVNGTVNCGNTNVAIRARYILVNGAFQCGTYTNRFAKKLARTLRGIGSGHFNGFGDKHFVVAGGRLDLHGTARFCRTRLTQTADRCANRLTISEDRRARLL